MVRKENRVGLYLGLHGRDLIGNAPCAMRSAGISNIFSTGLLPVERLTLRRSLLARLILRVPTGS